MTRLLYILSILLLASVATAQDYANESASTGQQAQEEEKDPVALHLIDAMRLELMQDIFSVAGESRMADQRAGADFANLIRNLPHIPDEIKDIQPPQIGVDGSLGFDLRLFAPDGERWTTYWHPVSSNIYSDRMVAVTPTNTPGYLGATGSDGVLRTSLGIDYEYGGDFITLSGTIDANNGYVVVTNGTARGQVLWWDDSVGDHGRWIPSDTPSSPAVLVYDAKDNTNGSVRWETLDAIYKGIFRDSSTHAVSDYPRVN